MLREKLIEAAARVYGEHGFRGATTRRIAEAAGVNEVTLFRLFGSKQALIEAVVQACAAVGALHLLPDVPREPERELTEWTTQHLEMLRTARSLIRTTMGEMEERPEVACRMGEGSRMKAQALKDYMFRLEAHGFVTWAVSSDSGRDELAHAAGAMLMGALFADAMGRDMIPDMYPQPPERAAAMYVRLFLRAIACRAEPVATNGRRRSVPAGRAVKTVKPLVGAAKALARKDAPRVANGARGTGKRTSTKNVAARAPSRRPRS